MILPGATLGILGSGQLGRMFAIAARRMGYRVHVFSPDYDTPTGQVADLEIKASYDDLDAISDFARKVSVVTFEFENVPSATCEVASQYAPVRPAGSVLNTTQNRLREKNWLVKAGIPVAPFREIHNESDLTTAIDLLGCPAVLKTAGWGYDGKGQVKIEDPSRAQAAYKTLSGQSSILEAFVDFEQEISVVAARGLDGDVVFYGPIANSHRNHILDVSVAPAPVAADVRNEALEITRTIVEELDVIGILCVEFFQARDGSLMVNELAPRPHNSGHLTIDACHSCQFEQQVRAVCGLPLGSPDMLRPAAMANLLGDLWTKGEPDWKKALAFSTVKLHLYGKLDARPGRKMGHLTALGDTPEDARQRVIEARAALTARNG